jgi:hypothetical protein
MFTVGRSNFAALLSSDDEGEEAVRQEKKTAVTEVVEGTAEEKTTGEASEEAVVEDEEWCPVVTGKKKGGQGAPKEGVSANPGTGKAAASKFPASFSKPHHAYHHHAHHPHGATIIGNGQKKPLQTSQLPPLTLAEICDAAKSLELHGFPSKYRTGNLRKFVEGGIPSGAGYRLKWQNDSSCWVVFDEADSLTKALEALAGDEFIQVRRFDPANLVLTEELMHAKEAAHPAAESAPASASVPVN